MLRVSKSHLPQNKNQFVASSSSFGHFGKVKNEMFRKGWRGFLFFLIYNIRSFRTCLGLFNHLNLTFNNWAEKLGFSNRMLKLNIVSTLELIALMAPGMNVVAWLISFVLSGKFLGQEYRLTFRPLHLTTVDREAKMKQSVIRCIRYFFNTGLRCRF